MNEKLQNCFLFLVPSQRKASNAKKEFEALSKIKDIETESELSQAEEEENDEDPSLSDSGETDSGSDATSSGEEKDDRNRKSESLKRKLAQLSKEAKKPKIQRKRPVKADNRKKKVEKTSSIPTDPVITENQHPTTETVDDSKDTKDNKETKERKGRNYPLFSDQKVDINLYDNDPENVVKKVVKLNNSTILLCRMEASSGIQSGATQYEYAALVFQKKMKDSKAFEFNLPLSIAPRLVEGLKYIMKSNPKFFEQKLA
jgi:hypothetical protein